LSLLGETTVKRKAVRLKALPPVPDTGWVAPAFPNLDNAYMIGVDTETYDPELGKSGGEAGPGWGRHKGHIIGASISAIDRQGNTGKWYFPMRHEVEPETNLNPDHVLGWLQHTLGERSSHIPKVFANCLYDIGWLDEEGVKIKGPIHDVQYAEAIIDNNALVGLDHLGEKYLKFGKKTDVLKPWVMNAYKGPVSEWKANLYRTPPRLVGPYGEDDALMPILILPHQGKILDDEELLAPYRLECNLAPLLIEMRKAGVYVDVAEAEQLLAELRGEIKETYRAIWREYGFMLESTDSRQIGKLFDHVGISYPTTPKTKQAKIEKEWLDVLDHPLGDVVHDLREQEKICGTFIESYILNKNVNGYLYPMFHPVKGDDGGTLVYRFSSSGPNLQNIPSRTKLGKRVRKLFKPDPGHSHWRKHDYSQIHYRILAHYAVGPGSDELRASYINDPEMDYHMRVYKEVAPLIGWNTDYTKVPNKEGKLDWNDDIQMKRRPIKNTNFGLLYGLTDKNLRKKYLGDMSESQVKEFFASYHKGAPYVKATMEAIAAEAAEFTYVRTLLGRKIRFYLWEEAGFNLEKGPALRYENAVRMYGSNIQLAKLYRAVNYKFQGSEPDIMKTGMLNCWNSGVFDFTGVPRLTVHDELDFSVRDNSPQMREAFDFIQHEMQNAITLRIPVNVDASEGLTWGDAK
jgi:DNA polymerase-1